MPRSETHGKVGEIEGQWWLKVWGERLLFCAAQAPERVFAVLTPCPENADLAAFWRTAVKREDFGRLLLDWYEFSSVEYMMRFVVIYASDGRMWLREWCSGPWCEVQSAGVPPPEIWHPGWRGRLLLPFRNTLLRDLRGRPFAASERQNQPLLWLRGSCAQWKSVLRARSALRFAGLSRDQIGAWIDPEEQQFYGYAHAPFEAGAINFSLGENAEIAKVWEALFARHFVFVGWRWTPHPRHDPNVRAGWELQQTPIDESIPLLFQASHHEQLEARLLLRDWLHDKVPADQIPALLE